MAFWSTADLNPARQNNFIVRVGDTDFDFLAKSVTKPTLETDVNEYRLINQIMKFPSVPKWTDITITYVDSNNLEVYNKLIGLMLPSGNTPQKEWVADAIQKTEGIDLFIEQYDSEKQRVSTWSFQNSFISSIKFGENDYSSDDFVEIEITIAYDYAYLE